MDDKLGTYNLRSFFIKFNNYEKFNFEDNKHLELFIHEYFHCYIQFHSLFNLEGILRYNKLIDKHHEDKEFTNFVLSNQNLLEQVPEIKGYQNWIKRIQIDDGDKNESIYKKFKIKEFSPSDFKIKINDEKSFNFYDVIIYNENHPDAPKKFVVNERLINESMAFQIESALGYRASNFDKNFKCKPDDGLQYLFLKQVIDQNNISLIAIILISFISLQHSNHGTAFVDILRKDRNFLKTFTPEYEYLNTKKEYIITKNQLKDLVDYYQSKLEETNFKIYFDGIIKEYEKSINKISEDSPFLWVYDKYHSMIKILKDKSIPKIFNFLLEGKIQSINEILNELISEFPSPIIIDKDSINNKELKIIGSLNQEEADNYILKNKLLFGISSIYNLIYIKKEDLKKKDFECPYYTYCEHKNKSDKCKKQAWITLKNLDSCDLALSAKYLNFDAYEFEKTING